MNVRYIALTALGAALACATPDDRSSDTARADASGGRGEAAGGTAAPGGGSGSGGAAGSAALDCGVGSGSATLEETGVGALRIGRSVSDVRGACRVERDATVPGSEGMPERRLTVMLGSEPTVAAVVNDRVHRIELDSPRFRTSDGLGVGTRMSELRAPNAVLAVGEGQVFVRRRDHCGLSFRMAGAFRAGVRSLAAVPDTTRVDRVLVVGGGCP